MKKIILGLSFLSSILISPTFADDAAKEARKKEMFQDAKSMATKNIDQRISALQETKSCISSASDKDALKKCREAAKDKAKNFRKENKERRKEFKDKIKAERSKRKSERENSED